MLAFPVSPAMATHPAHFKNPHITPLFHHETGLKNDHQCSEDAFAFFHLGANISSWAFLAGTAKVKALSMLGVASSGGALGIFLSAMVLSFKPSLAWLIGAVLSGGHFW